MTKTKKNILSLLPLYAIAVYILACVSSFPKLSALDGGSPGFYPLVLSVLMILLITLVLIECKTNALEFTLPEKSDLTVMVAIIIALLLVPQVLHFLGFILTGTLFMTFSIISLQNWRVNKDQMLKAIVFSVLIIGLFYVVFTYGAKIMLPKGFLF